MVSMRPRAHEAEFEFPAVGGEARVEGRAPAALAMGVDEPPDLRREAGARQRLHSPRFQAA